MFDAQALVNQIQGLVDPLLQSRRITLVELTCRPQGGQILVRFLVDTATGITIGQLRDLNLAIGALLEEHDLIPEHYTLEVSSPGLDRPLKTTADFERVITRRIKVFLTGPLEGRWEYAGKLVGAGEEFISLELDSGQKVRVDLSQIQRAVQEISL